MQEDVLLIDIGNSKTKTARWSTAHGLRRGASWTSEHISTLAPVFAQEPWAGVVISSVVSVDALATLVDKLEERHVPCIVVSSELINELGLVSGFYPGQGADRIANVVGVAGLYQLPALCVDMGTAITFDLVDDTKRYQGGLIAPSPALMAHALADRTAGLPRVEASESPGVLAADTATAISSGCWWGGVALFNGLLDVLAKRGISWQTLVFTGGICEEYGPRISFPHIVDTDVAFKGMTFVWQAGNARTHSR
jgi:type III pantothenate kinase